ncbi:MAG: hypothetical protein Q9218_007347, partial [Villophora microphyllina]
MAELDSSLKARIILEAVDLATAAEVASLQQLIAREPDILTVELVLRILLTYLPESTDPTLYNNLLQQLGGGHVHEPPHSALRPVYSRKEWSDDEARRQTRQLHLLPVAQEQDLQGGCTDLLSLFLIHRARQIDGETGSIGQIQQLLEPFIDRDPYLRTYLITNVLPLRRFDYEYYPQIEDTYTLEAFEQLEGRPAIDALLSRSVRNASAGPIQASRDIRGIVGPWMYRGSRRKRRKTNPARRRSSASTLETIGQNASLADDGSCTGWSDVNGWIVDLALRDFSAAAETIGGWDGPSDVDYGGYIDQPEQDNSEMQVLDRRYGQAGLAAIYATTDTSPSCREGSHSVLQKVARHTGLQEPPGLDDPKWQSVSSIPSNYVNQITEIHLLHNSLQRHDNPLTTPTQVSISFASLLLTSGVLLQKLGHPMRCREIVALALFRNAEEHTQELTKLLQKVPVRTRDEDAWAGVRRSVLRLRDWHYQPSIGASDQPEDPLGVLRKVKREEAEVALLKAILRAS